MHKIKILGDSTCDLPKHILEQYDVQTMGLPVVLGDELKSDGVDVFPEDLYAYYERTGKLCKTTAPNSMDYLEFWKPYLDEGYEIIHFHISTDISGTYNASRMASEECGGTAYPIDSRTLSTGIGLLIIEACKMREAGKSAKEIVEEINIIKHKVQASFLVDTIEYLWKGGRCSGIAALGANMLKLKPRIDLVDGKMISTKKYRGKTEKCFANYADDLLKDKTDIKLEYILITHSGINQNILELITGKIKEHQPEAVNVVEAKVGASVACHCGPGTLGIIYLQE